MAPLIDVVFLLLTFFVFSIVLLTRVSVVELDLPVLGAGGGDAPPRAVIVAVDRAGMVFVAGREVGPSGEAGNPLPQSTRGALAGAVREERDAIVGAGGGDPPIRLEVDESGASGAMLRVLDAIRAEGFGAVELVGRPSASTGERAGDPGGEQPGGPGS